MTLNELKKSLTRFPPDVDDTEVVLITEDWKSAKLLAFTAYAKVGEKLVMVLGSPEAIPNMDILNPPEKSA